MTPKPACREDLKQRYIELLSSKNPLKVKINQLAREINFDPDVLFKEILENIDHTSENYI